MTPQGLTDEWLSSALGSEVRVLESTRIGDGLVGMNLRLALRSDGSVPSSLIAKLPSLDATSRATGFGLGNYEREVRFYEEVAPTVDIRVARCFHAEYQANGDFVLLLEDLAPAVQGDQIAGCDRAQAALAVRELARLHGPRWADPALGEIGWLSRRTPDDALRLAVLWRMFFPGFAATFGPLLPAEALETIERFGERISQWFDGRGPVCTVTHGDYRLDNLMFAGPAGGVAIATVDWQTPAHDTGITDVSYFLGAGLEPPERREVERALVDEYGQALAEYGVAVDAAELWSEYRRDAYAGVAMSVIASQIVGGNARSQAMFATMAARHAQHVIDLDSETLL